MEFERSSGVLLHITSLPTPFGIGDIGPAAYDFLDFLKAAGNHYWQLLPLNPTDEIYNHSPYSSHSAFAGNPLLISPVLLEQAGYLNLEDFKAPASKDPGKVNFKTVVAYKEQLFDAAFLNFKEKKRGVPEFQVFCKDHAFWLDDYSLYLALRTKFNDSSWTSWPAELRDRDTEALKKAAKELAAEIEKEKFEQFLFFSQWADFMKAAHEKKIQLIGDIPFYINHDSADCWANPAYFKLDENKQPTNVSGVPPDLFSKTGQLWGTPVYDWKELQKNDYDWWIRRIKQNLLLYDLVRLDHFRAFSAYWEVPAQDKTAMHGKWVKTPGTDFFKVLNGEFPDMPFIAEDLGSLDQPVFDLLKRFDFPGMKVLQFAFGDDKAENPYLPFNHLPHSLVYTGTHDNNTSRGWFKKMGKSEKEHLRAYAGLPVNSGNVHKILHRLALQSPARVAIIPMQDIIGLGEEGIMNIPGSTEGNWIWRMTSEEIPGPEATAQLMELNRTYGRFADNERE